MSAPRFLADRMLGKLARLLRMIGYDAAYVREGEPERIVHQAREDGRILLTRDKKIGRGEDVLLLRSNYPFHQARAVIRALGLSVEGGFTRCVEDNGVLVVVENPDRHRETLPDSAKDLPLFACDSCNRVYWEGSHVRAMREVIAALAQDPLIDGADDDEEDDAVVALGPLVDLHQAMDVLLLKHRLALMKTKPDEALRWLRRFSLCMRRHIEHERELVLPRYRSTEPAGGFERGAAPELFENEHEKILRHLTRMEAATEALGDAADDATSVACLQLLDREKIFRDLLEHHDDRERSFLYPALEHVLTDHEKTDLLERMVGRTFDETT